MVANRLSARLGGAWKVRALGASSFCDTWRAEGAAEALFVKSTSQTRADVLQAEADGLAALAATRRIRVPAVAACWNDADSALLALEWLDFAPQESRGFGARLGHALAALHHAPAPGDGRFGWSRDNWLGGTPQRNRWSAQGGRDGWIAFVGQQRLLPLAQCLAAPLPHAVQQVVSALPSLFDDGHVPRPALIHGDLWSGNWACLRSGEPVIFDPAVSVSDAEAELAMMELFGAPPAGFWPAYCERASLAEGYARRRSVYQLVHLLNHTRLFGGGYARQALALCESICG
ncbi:MAG: fructosamine kinase family protein [Burkholderiaceae bacterium]|nr:fructosamine kinase family protein [Burkholderiaceae bacterium]